MRKAGWFIAGLQLGLWFASAFAAATLYVVKKMVDETINDARRERRLKNRYHYDAY